MIASVRHLLNDPPGASGEWLKGLLIVAASVYGSIAPPFIGLIGFIVLDYASGWLTARSRGELSSSIGWKGLIKKLTIVAASLASYLMEWMMVTSPAFARFAHGDPTVSNLLSLVSFGDAFTAMLAINEFTSILGNGVRGGAITWPPLVAWFENAQAKRTRG